MKMSRSIVSMGVILAGVTALCLAQDAGSPLTLTQCRQLAEKYNYDLMIQSERKVQAGERFKQARGAALPNVAYKYDRDLSDTAGGAVSGDNANARLAVSQPLFYGSRLAEGIALTKSEIEREGYRYENIARTLNAQVTQTFYSIAQAESDIANVRESYAALQDRLRELRERARLGKSRESEVLMVEAQMASLRSQEKQLAGNREQLAETLSLLTGVPAASVTINDDTPPVDHADPLDYYLASVKERPDIKTLRQDAVTQSYAVRIARGALLPTLSLNGAWYNQRTGSLSSIDWNALLALNVPLFQGGAARARVGEETSLLRQAEDQTSYAELQAATEIRQLYTALTSSLDQVAALQDAYAKTGKSYELQKRDYRYGLVNNLDVLQSISALLDVKSSLDRMRIQAKSDKALLDIAAVKVRPY